MPEQYIHLYYNNKTLQPTPNAWQLPDTQYTTYYVEQAHGNFALLRMDTPPNLRPFGALEYLANHIQLLRPDIETDMVESYLYDLDREAAQRTPYVLPSTNSLHIVVFFARSIATLSLHSQNLQLDLLQSLLPTPSCLREEMGQGSTSSLWHFTLQSLTALKQNDIAEGMLTVRRSKVVFDRKHLCLRSEHDSVGSILPEALLTNDTNITRPANRFSCNQIKKIAHTIDAGTAIQVIHYCPDMLPKIVYLSTIINDLRRDGFSVILPNGEKQRVRITDSRATESFVAIKKQIIEPIKSLNPHIPDGLLRHFIECVVPQSNVMAFIPSHLLIHIIGLSINHIEFSDTGIAQCFSRTGIFHNQTDRSIDIADEQDVDDIEQVLQQAITAAQKLNTKTDYLLNTMRMSESVILSNLSLQETLLNSLVEKTYNTFNLPPARPHLISIIGQTHMVIQGGQFTLTEPFFVLKYDASYNIQDFAGQFTPGPDECTRQNWLFSDTLELDFLAYNNRSVTDKTARFIQKRAGKKVALEVQTTDAADIQTITTLMIQNVAYDSTSYFDDPEGLKNARFLSMFPCQPWTVQRTTEQIKEPLIHILHGEMSTHKLLTQSYMKKNAEEMTVFIISTTSDTLFQSIPVSVFLEPANEDGQQDTLNALISGHIRAENAGLVFSNVAQHIAYCDYAIFQKVGDYWELKRQTTTLDESSSPIHSIGQQLSAKLIARYACESLPWSPYIQHIIEPFHQLKKSLSQNRMADAVTAIGNFGERVQDLMKQIWVMSESPTYINEIKRSFSQNTESLCVGSNNYVLAESIINSCYRAYDQDGWNHEKIEGIITVHGDASAAIYIHPHNELK